MNSLTVLNVVACIIIFIWAAWCILHQKVNDGVLGKVIFTCIALSCLSVILGNISGVTVPNSPGVSLHLCIAALGLRHIFIKHLWPKLLLRFRCAICPQKETK